MKTRIKEAKRMVADEEVCARSDPEFEFLVILVCLFPQGK
jgi:hypothetical protein